MVGIKGGRRRKAATTTAQDGDSCRCCYCRRHSFLLPRGQDRAGPDLSAGCSLKLMREGAGTAPRPFIVVGDKTSRRIFLT